MSFKWFNILTVGNVNLKKRNHENELARENCMYIHMYRVRVVLTPKLTLIFSHKKYK